MTYMVIAGCAICFVAMAPGCSLDLLGLVNGFSGAQSPADTGASEGMVKIRFRNLLILEAVDVQFYVADTALSNLPDDLFLPENLVTASIGVAGTGIVQPQKDDVIELPCTDNLTIGTQGGRFTDNETGEPRGTGAPRWVQEGPVELCGSIVSFEFSAGESDGDFNTTLTVTY